MKPHSQITWLELENALFKFIIKNGIHSPLNDTLLNLFRRSSTTAVSAESFRMFSLHMISHVRTIHEIFVAMWTLVVSLPRVNHVVNLQFVCLREPHIALVALDLLKVQLNVADNPVDSAVEGALTGVARIYFSLFRIFRYGVVAGPVLLRLVVGIFRVNPLVQTQIARSVELHRT